MWHYQCAISPAFLTMLKPAPYLLVKIKSDSMAGGFNYSYQSAY